MPSHLRWFTSFSITDVLCSSASNDNHDTTRDTPTRSCQNCAKRERGAKITKLIREGKHAKSQIRALLGRGETEGNSNDGNTLLLLARREGSIMGEMDPTSRDSRRANQLFNGDAAESGASLTALRTTTIMPGVSNVGSIINLACKLCQGRQNVKRSA